MHGPAWQLMCTFCACHGDPKNPASNNPAIVKLIEMRLRGLSWWPSTYESVLHHEAIAGRCSWHVYQALKQWAVNEKDSFFSDILQRCVTHIYTSSQQVHKFPFICRSFLMEKMYHRYEITDIDISSLCPSCYYKQATQSPTGVASEQYSHLLPWICMVDTFFSGNQCMMQDEPPVAFCKMCSDASHSYLFSQP